MASGTVTYIPISGANVFQAGQGFPGTAATQQPVVLQYVTCGGQQPGIPSNPSERNPRLGRLEKFCKEETKTLGAVQIMIGLMHISFAVLSLVFPFRGYLFCSGLFFITSGSLSVSAEKHPTHGLTHCSLGMNITSAVVSLISMILYMINLIILDSNRYELPKSVGIGLCVLVILFSFLEFCICISISHFGCQATCCRSVPEAVVYVPYTVNGGVMTHPETCPTAPPAYNAVEPSSQRA